MTSHMGKSSNKNIKNPGPPKKSPSFWKNTLKSAPTQMDRVKEAETALNTLLTTVNPKHELSESGRGNMDSCLSRILKMTGELKKHIGEHKTSEKTPEENVNSSKTEQPPQKPVNLTENFKTKPIYKPFDFSTNESEYTKYFSLSMPEQLIRTVNPYEIIEKIKETTGFTPKQVTGLNKTSFTIEVANQIQSENLKNVTSVEGVVCKIAPHPFFNTSRGIIHLYDSNIDDIDEFQKYLKSQANISKITKADFIKLKREGAQAFIIDFNQTYMPRKLDIAGERARTPVYEFKNKPMLCMRCCKYGHRIKHCVALAPVCKRCSAVGHKIEECNAQTPKCAQCQNEHHAGDRDCEVQQKEQAIIDIQTSNKVTIRRARQIFEAVDETKTKTSRYPTHFDCKMNEADKKALSPWLLEKCFEGSIGSKPKSIRSKNSTTYTVEVTDQKQSAKIQILKELNGKQIQVEKNEHVAVNKGLIHVYNYNMKNFESFKRSLCEDLGLADATQATWIKSKNERSIALILDFRGELPTFVNIPGEQAKTRVFEYTRNPMICKNCSNYNHTAKYCEQATVCSRCGGEGHKSNQRVNDNEIIACENPAKCLHCGGPHNVGNKFCREQIF